MLANKIAEYVSNIKLNYEAQRDQMASYLGKDYGLEEDDFKRYTRALEKMRITNNLNENNFFEKQTDLTEIVISHARQAADCGYMNSTDAMTRAVSAIKVSIVAEVVEDMKRLAQYHGREAARHVLLT